MRIRPTDPLRLGLIIAGIGVAIGAIGVVSGIYYGSSQTSLASQAVQNSQRQIDIAQQEAERARALSVRLEYDYDLVLQPIDQQAIAKAGDQLVEDFYRRVYDAAKANPQVGYVQIVNAILPMTATLPARPVSVTVNVRNTGAATAKKVRAFLNSDRPITGFAVSSLEPSTVIEGGVGQLTLAVEIDRIEASGTVSVTIRSEGTPGSKKSDQLILSNSPFTFYAGAFLDAKKIFSATPSKSSSCQNADAVPCPNYIPGEAPIITVTVTSEEGRAILRNSTPVATPSPARLTPSPTTR